MAVHSAPGLATSDDSLSFRNDAWLRESHDRLEAYRRGEIGQVDGEAALAAIEEELRQK